MDELVKCVFTSAMVAMMSSFDKQDMTVGALQLQEGSQDLAAQTTVFIDIHLIVHAEG